MTRRPRSSSPTLAAILMALLALPHPDVRAQGIPAGLAAATAVNRTAPPPHPARKQHKAAANPFATAEAIARYIAAYRANPEPQKFGPLFHAVVELGLLGDGDTSGIYLGFLGAMLAAEPANAADAIRKLFPLAPEHQAALIKVIAFSGTPNWRDLLRQFAERMPARVVLIDRYVTGRMKSLADMKLDDGPQPLDILWGNYYASGSPEPILRMISALPWSKDVNDVEKLTIGSMTKWTLAANASGDPDLLRLLKETVPTQTNADQQMLTEVIAAAETGEISAIRKQALVAIDQLKAKGPAKTRSMAWWGQAGQMAIAAGCVAASALGAAATIGIPCVIGGVASQAALKLAQPQ